MLLAGFDKINFYLQNLSTILHSDPTFLFEVSCYRMFRPFQPSTKWRKDLREDIKGKNLLTPLYTLS